MNKFYEIALLLTLLCVGCFFIYMGLTLHPITPILCIVAGGGIFSFVTFFFFDLLALEKSRKRAALRDGRKF
jgi:hypothetical protein